MEKEQDVIVAKSAGFCPGVKRAIDKVLELEAAGKKPIYTIGPLIHNKQVTDMLAAKQISSIDKPQEAADKSGVLVIRAHGITPQFQQEIESCGMEVVDATCPLVKHAQDVIAKYAQQGYDTVIVGDGGHAEVIGLLGYTEGRGTVVSGPEEAQKLPHFKKVNVVSQTTQKETVFYQTAQIIKEKADECQISNTICQPTKDRQKETIEQAKNADLVIVVGGKHSANTARLALLCRGLAPQVLHIETEAELQPEQVLRAQKIFITAGASTPNWVIDKVANWVRQTRQTHNRFSLSTLFYNGWKTFVKYSFYTAFAAMALSYVCMKLQGVRTDWKLLWFAWLFVFGLTSVNHAAERAPTRARSISYTLGFTACAAALVLAALAGWQIFVLAAVFLAAGVFYPFRHVLHSKLASFPGTKDIATALGWAFACAWLPAYAHGVPFHKAAYLAVFYAGLLVFTRSVTLGFSSVNKDLMVGKESFYKAFGIAATKWAVTFILTALTGVLAALWFMPWKPLLTGMLLIGNVYTVFIVIYYYSHVTARNIKQETLIDGQFFILGLLCYLTKLFKQVQGGKMTIKKIGILTAGGDCPGLNAVVRAVSKNALQHGIEVLGFKNGFDGLVRNEFVHITNDLVSGILTLGGTILGSSNIANPFKYTLAPFGSAENPADLSGAAMHNFKENQLDALITIGGDGTLHMSQQFVDMGMPIVAVPKTIDNDLSATDQTFGFDSALAIATEAIDRLHTTAQSHHRVMIVETMGRYAGWIALRSAIAGGGDIVLIPEIPYNDDVIANYILDRRSRGKTFSIVVAAEGAKNEAGEQAVTRTVAGSTDPVRLGGIAYKLSQMIEEKTKIESRACVLGHTQRGGTPTAFDRWLSTLYGTKALDMVLEGKFGYMASLRAFQMQEVKISDAISKLKRVDPYGEEVKAALEVGMSFGSADIG